MSTSILRNYPTKIGRRQPALKARPYHASTNLGSRYTPPKGSLTQPERDLNVETRTRWVSADPNGEKNESEGVSVLLRRVEPYLSQENFPPNTTLEQFAALKRSEQESSKF